MKQLRASITAKLTVATLLPLCVAIVICWFTGVFILTSKIVSQAHDKVRNDLNAAREVYNHELDHIRDVVRFTAAAAYTADALAGATPVKIATLLDPLLKSEQLDILTAVDATGRVIYRASNPAVAGDDQAANRFVARALKGEILSGTSIFPARELALENPALAEQAVIPLVPTPRSRPRSDTVERAGMLQVAAAPVRDRFGNLVGVLYGGTLLNNNNRLVDRVRNLVYEGVKYQGQNVGSSTIFLGDLRIATNVPTSDGGRAIGTRMSTEVYNRLILNREKWLGRAFVVSDWYFTAYEPILSL
ncbi:MAG TPA: cache domain-containing protein, partial [Geobacteraceae bacterium]